MRYIKSYAKGLYLGPDAIVQVVEGAIVPGDILAKYKEKLELCGAIESTAQPEPKPKPKSKKEKEV